MMTQPSQAGLKVSIFPRMKFPSVVATMLCILLSVLRVCWQELLKISSHSAFSTEYLSSWLCKEVHIVLIHFPTQEASIGYDRIWASITGEIKILFYYFRGINFKGTSLLSFPS